MILPVYLLGNPVLRKKSLKCEDPIEILQPLIADMFETMYQAHGVGLAAPQIGKPIRLFIIDSESFKESYPDVELYKGAFINPEILDEFGDDFIFNEGCLSLPDIHEDIIRKSEIEIKFVDETGKERHEKFKGYVARIIQHEYDHLEGKVFTDKISGLKKMMLKRKLTDISTGKMKTDYKVKI
jgi:peptide deformylase